MTFAVSLVIVLLTFAASSLAGPNEGGTLVIHYCAESCTPFSYDEDDYCGVGSLPTQCVDVITNQSNRDIGVWHVFAAFRDRSSPLLGGVKFGITYHGTITIVAFGSCRTSLELPTDTWPASGSGTSIFFEEPRTGLFEEIYWFAGYDYHGVTASFRLDDHPVHGGRFEDDHFPPILDPIAGYGELGFFGDPGSRPCPAPIGACCMDDGSCVLLHEEACHSERGSWFDRACDPNPCQGACCLPDDSCVLGSADECDDERGEYLGYGTLCESGLCEGTGACCRGDECSVAPRAACLASGGAFLGDGVPCEAKTCVAYDCEGDLVSLEELGLRGDLSARGDPAVSVGPDVTTLVGSRGTGCGFVLFNSDETYEGGYAWRYGGTVPPCFGAFAERYETSGAVCAVLLDFSTTGTQNGQTLDAYVWTDAGGIPGAVHAVAIDVDPGTVAFWPSISRHAIPISTKPVPEVFWVGYWGNWPGDVQGWFTTEDADGLGGYPRTHIAPGIGYPTGWQNVSIVWGPAQAIGIGVEMIGGAAGACCIDVSCVVLPRVACDEHGGTFLGEKISCTDELCNPVVVRQTSWGRIKARFTPLAPPAP